MSIGNITGTMPAPAKIKTRVFIDGLSILCFNNNPAQAELGFLDVPNHPFEMKIYQDNGALFWTSETLDPDYLRNSQIIINPDNFGTGFRYQNPLGKESDASDSRWLIDLEELYRQPVNFLPSTSIRPFFSRLYVRNGIFFTQAKSVNDAILTAVDPPGGQINIGRISKVIGIALIDENMAVEIKRTDGSSVIALPLISGPYVIDIRHKCDPASLTPEEKQLVNRGDFYRFYDVIKVPTGQPKYDLQFSGPEPNWTYSSEGEQINPSAENAFVCEEACQSASLLDRYRELPA